MTTLPTTRASFLLHRVESTNNSIRRSFRAKSLSSLCFIALLSQVLAIAAGPTPVALARPRTPVLRQFTAQSVGSLSDVKLRGQRGDQITFLDPDGTLYFIDLEANTLEVAFDQQGTPVSDPTSPTDPDGLGRWPSYVAFASAADLDPGVGNADGNREIFLWETDSGELHQLTNTLAPVQNSQPFASDTGECVVFSSTGNLDDNDGSDVGFPSPGFSNTDASLEVFLYGIRSGTAFPSDGFFTQISQGPSGTSSDAAVVGGYTEPRQCRSIAYRSDHDQLSAGFSGTHLYSYNRGSAVLEDMTTRKGLPDGPPDGIYGAPSISGASNFARGPFIVFTTAEDLWRNDSTGGNIYRYRFFHPELRQITALTGSAAENPVTSDGGGRVAFRSRAEVLEDRGTPHNADGNREIFRIKGRRRVLQITDTSGCDNGPPSMRSDGTRIAFWSDCNLIPGSSPAGVRQVYLYQQVERGDPLETVEGCRISEGCCNEANNCLRIHQGKLPKVPRRGCLDRARGC